jgi:predicted DNA-binding WGR domain protein
MNIIRKVALRFKDFETDKVYEIELIEDRNNHIVKYRYGNTGGKLQEGTKTKTRVAKKKAHKIFDTLVKEKLKKGYIIWGDDELSVVDTIVAVLKEAGEIPQSLEVDSELKDLEGAVNDVICPVLETILPDKTIEYPNFDGGWVGETVAEEYKKLITSIVSKTNGAVNISNLKVVVDDKNLPEDEREIEISFDHKGCTHAWSFMMDDAGGYYNGITKWISDALCEEYLYLSDADLGLFGFFLSKKTITRLKEIGVTPMDYSPNIGNGYIDLRGKYISFAVLYKYEYIIESWYDELEIYGGFPQMVINEKTDYVVYGDLDEESVAELNDFKLLEKAKNEGRKLLSFYTLQDLFEQFEYY